MNVVTQTPSTWAIMGLVLLAVITFAILFHAVRHEGAGG
jgi:hypothetical protein